MVKIKCLNIYDKYSCSFIGNVFPYISEIPKVHGQVLYGMVTATNSVGLSVSSYSEAITVDDTPPVAGMVVELSSITRIDPFNAAATVSMNLMACQTEEGNSLFWV